MKVYVAGASSEIERAEKWMAALRAAGIEVVSSWPGVIRKVGDANPMGAARSDRMHWAAQDLSEVAHAEVFWFLLPEGRPTAGAYTEFGYALFLGSAANEARNLGIPAPPFWIIASGKETSIFTALADHRATDEEAFESVKRRAQLFDAMPRRQSAFGGEFGEADTEGG